MTEEIEKDTDLHTLVHSASDSDALKSSQVVGLLPYPGQRKIRLSNFIKFHDVEHLEEDGIDVGVPALVEMTIAPMGDGRGFHFGIDFIHDGTLMIQIEDQVGIILYPGTDACLALHFAKGGGCVRDDSINRILCKYLRQKFLIEHWHLVLPIIVQSQWVLIIKNVSEPQLIHHVSVPCRYSILSVNRDGSSDTQGSMSVCFHHRIIRNSYEPLVRNCLSVKIGRIVMVARTNTIQLFASFIRLLLRLKILS